MLRPRVATPAKVESMPSPSPSPPASGRRPIPQAAARLLHGPGRYLAALIYVAVAVVIAEGFYRLLGFTRLSPVFLAPILVAAVTLGTRPAFFAAALAFAVYNFYVVEPRFTFSLDSPQEFLTLIMFLAVALLTGWLAGRVRDEGVHSKARARTMGALFEASRQLSSTDQEEALRAHLAQQVAAAAKGEAELVHQDRVWRATAEPVPATTEWMSRPLLADGVEMGLARWRSAEPPERGAAEVQGLVQVLVDVGAAAIARSRLAWEKGQIETVARTERLRTALLSSISHDFRTPLTAILTSISSLREFGDRFEPQVRDDLMSTIEEEAERLNRYVANLLSITKLESGALDVETGPAPLAELLDRLVRRQRARAGGRTLTLALADKRLCARGDVFLLEQALANVLENAVRFSPDGSLISVRAGGGEGRVQVEIVDQGPGVPSAERERIFEKFYRAQGPGANTPGTGLGLSIARGMVEAMDGRIDAHARVDGAPGLRVVVDLPAMDLDEG
jgi:two-component system sensor histidine kinase KdpD